MQLPQLTWMRPHAHCLDQRRQRKQDGGSGHTAGNFPDQRKQPYRGTASPAATAQHRVAEQRHQLEPPKCSAAPVAMRSAAQGRAKAPGRNYCGVRADRGAKHGSESHSDEQHAGDLCWHSGHSQQLDSLAMKEGPAVRTADPSRFVGVPRRLAVGGLDPTACVFVAERACRGRIRLRVHVGWRQFREVDAIADRHGRLVAA